MGGQAPRSPCGPRSHSRPTRRAGALPPTPSPPPPSTSASAPAGPAPGQTRRGRKHEAGSAPPARALHDSPRFANCYISHRPLGGVSRTSRPDAAHAHWSRRRAALRRAPGPAPAARRALPLGHVLCPPPGPPRRPRRSHVLAYVTAGAGPACSRDLSGRGGGGWLRGGEGRGPGE